MTDEKLTLMEQIRKQRFLPITDNTYSLYGQFRALMDSHNPDELSFLLFHEGEYYFRVGNFDSALNHLTRCLSGPKQDSFRYLDALSYNIIGLIYSFLGLYHISLNYLLQFKSICSELHLTRENAICHANLSLIYGKLEAYDVALDHLDRALDCPLDSAGADYDLQLICHTYRGILYCKMNDMDSALNAYHNIRASLEETHAHFYDPAIFSFYIRIARFLKDDALLQENLHNLLSRDAKASTFLEVSNFYYDTCEFFLKQHMQAESLALLDFMESFTGNLPVCCFAHRLLTGRAVYARLFSSDEAYADACDAVFSLRSRYRKEQNQAKLYSLTYIEHMNQTKSDSEMYLEKSRLDPLTGLLNKYTVQFLAKEDLAKLNHGRRSAMLLLDLEHARQRNDTLKHLISDSIIQQAASVIQEFFEDDAFCGRIDGNEFLVYIRDVTDPSLLILQAEILRQEVFNHASQANPSVTPEVSIGIALSSDACRTYEKLFDAADKALYRSKTDNRNRVSLLS